MCMEQEIAANLATAQFTSTVGTGGTDIYVDGPLCPQGSIMYIKAISIAMFGHVVSPFPTVLVCDQSRTNGENPLNTGGQFDATKSGYTAITAADETSPGSTNIMTSVLGGGNAQSNFGLELFIRANWFLRFSTQTGTTGGPSSGAYFTVQITYAILPACDN